MKLKNKQTGEIAIFRSIPKWNDKSITLLVEDTKKVYQYDTFTQLANEWEDYEEPKDYWYIDDLGRVQFSCFSLDEVDGKPNNGLIRKCYGNYFSSKEEAEKAVRKLQAWKRLKDKGFKFAHCDWTKELTVSDIHIYADIDCEWSDLVEEDLQTVFGGEE